MRFGGAGRQQFHVIGGEGDHPRVRGEHTAAQYLAVWRRGPSPRGDGPYLKGRAAICVVLPAHEGLMIFVWDLAGGRGTAWIIRPRP